MFELPSGVELTIQVIPTGTDVVAIEGKATLDPAGAYTVAAIGGANNWELALLPLVDETMPSDSGALVRIGHLAPFADANTPGSTAVDICTDDGTAILEGVEYPQVTDYLSLDAGTYDLLIALAGTDCAGVALDLPALELNDGDIVDVFAIGLLPDDANFPLQAASTTGFDLAPATRQRGPLCSVRSGRRRHQRHHQGDRRGCGRHVGEREVWRHRQECRAAVGC